MSAGRRLVPVPDPVRRTLAVVGAILVGSGIAQPVAAHGGSVHRGTPHWVFLGLILVGMAAVTASVVLSRRRWGGRPGRTLTGVFAGAILVVVGTIALVEFQIEPLGTNATPIPRSWYSVVAFGAGTAILFGSIGVGLWRWPHRPAYVALGCALGLYVAYPVFVPGIAIFHPAGYLLVFTLVGLVGGILWRDVGPGLRGTDRLSRRTGMATAGLFVVFLLFSSGQLTLSPVTGVSGPTDRFVVVYQYANPLVMWPAVEFYFPSIPLFGALSVGTAIMFGLLGTLVGVNATLATRVYQSDRGLAGAETTLGALATTGATACCCCAPAAYGIASAAVGLSASPLYWIFVDSQSPLGSLFFVSAVAIMTASAVHLAIDLDRAGLCSVPTASGSSGTSEKVG